jgi:cephalosporin hydroxylase
MLDLTKVALIQGWDKQFLNYSTYIEKQMMQLGFNTELLHEQPNVVKENGGGLRIWQYPNQFSKYLCLLREQNIHSYIEIGCRWGGTFILTTEYLKLCNDAFNESTAVDLIDSPVKEYCDANSKTVFIKDNSQSEQFKSFVQSNYFDLIFIDGDHSYEGVKTDYESCKNNGRIFVFHDIVSDACPGVVKFWNELKTHESDKYDFYEYVGQYDEVFQKTGKQFLGIGVAIKKAKICYITAIFGNYELTCKNMCKQTVASDFICFTESTSIKSNGWIIDKTPYHISHKSELDDGCSLNSFANNKHSFNVAKYYKQSFQKIPRLKHYDVIVWLDGTIEITYDKTSEYLLSKIYTEKVIGWHHEWRRGILKQEAHASVDSRYTSTYWNNQHQPYQDVKKQYEEYLKDGYSEEYFKQFNSHTPNLGVWITCFVAFLNKDEEVKRFLELWYLQTLKHSTQDQVGFSYVCQKSNLIPFTLPNAEITGDCPHDRTQFYIKRAHNS